ncbi:MAG TPA: hypothetical protein VGJ28_25645, partial [Micromonosporaceae bacterium]
NASAELYIVPGDDLRKGVHARHAEFLAKHDGSRPKNGDSKHSTIAPAAVAEWRDQWSLFDA